MSPVIRASFGAGVALALVTACRHQEISQGCELAHSHRPAMQRNNPLPFHQGSVAGADLIGTRQGIDIYATSVGEGGAVVIDVSNLSDAATTVTWKGGSPGDSRLQRLVNRSLLNEAGERVTAEANGRTLFDGQVHVFQGAPVSSEVAIHQEMHRDDTAVPLKVFGISLIAANSPKTQYQVYYTAGKWRFIFERLSYRITWGVHSLGRADVLDPAANPFPVGLGMSDDSSEKQKKEKAKADLTPNGDGNVPRSAYYSSKLVEEHEQFHHRDFLQFLTPKMLEVESFIEAQEVTVTSTCLNPKFVRSLNAAAFDSKVRQASDRAYGAYTGGNTSQEEVRAYREGKDAYATLSNAIQP
jgi:hypothetical protein